MEIIDRGGVKGKHIRNLVYHMLHFVLLRALQILAAGECAHFSRE